MFPPFAESCSPPSRPLMQLLAILLMCLSVGCSGISSSTGIGMHGRLGLPGGQEPCSNLAEHHMSLPSIDSHKPGHQTFYLLTSSQSVSPTCSAEQTKEAKGNNGLSESLFAAIRLGSTNNRISYFPQAPPIDLESME